MILQQLYDLAICERLSQIRAKQGDVNISSVAIFRKLCTVSSDLSPINAANTEFHQ